MDMSSSQPAVPLAERLLLIEDDEADVQLFRRLLTSTGDPVALDIATDGETAVGWLNEKLVEARTGHPALPRAIFVDLKLPGMCGMDVLRWIRSVPELDRTLVAVCSACAESRDIDQARDLHADLYVPKYPSLKDFAAILAITLRRSGAQGNEAATAGVNTFRQLEHAATRIVTES